MSAIGTKRTCRVAPHMSAFAGKADMNVLHCTCLLLTQSGHSLVGLLASFYVTFGGGWLWQIMSIGNWMLVPQSCTSAISYPR